MKKNFADNAAAAFISTATTAEPPADNIGNAAEAEAAPAPLTDTERIRAARATMRQESQLLIMYRKPKSKRGEESRSHRTLLLTRPSVYAAAAKFCEAQKASFNTIVEKALLFYMEHHNISGKRK